MRIFIALSIIMLVVSCGEEKQEKKESFENDSFVDIMGKPGNAAIGNTGLMIELPGKYRIDQKNSGGDEDYLIHPADTTLNRSSIRIHLGPNPDTISPKSGYTRDAGPAEFLGRKGTKVLYRIGDRCLYRIFLDDWKGKKLMFEEITTNQVEAFDLEKVANTIREDSSSVSK